MFLLYMINHIRCQQFDKGGGGGSKIIGIMFAGPGNNFGGFKKNFFTFVGVFLVMVLIVSGGYFVWNKYFSEAEKAQRFAEEQIRIQEETEKAYVEAMTADTYGGRTPQETLNLFVEALRAEDIELASKYFLLDENLSREKWTARLTDIKDRGLLGLMAQDIISKAQSDLENRLNENDFKFVLYDDNGRVGARVDMHFNKYSQVWKIESL